ncbi:unnamed protein product [Notodromas monacha]|uniref:UBX domain-containing protein n=1 Tax=Notodromas monacha TaxID=399045 RepID=A0A7R9BZL8_9CRUS|nr:unnamed protein product [Notodromas monacha]CAG0923023.1 unnamed protein product [Notodromas monacha]
MAFQTFTQEYFQIPPVTRAYATACVLTSLAVVSSIVLRRSVPFSIYCMSFLQQLDVVSPFQLYFNPILIWRNFQVWRIFTTFFFFGTIGFNFLFNMIFTYRYCRMLEEGSFRGRTSDFVMMFLFGGFVLIFLGLFVNLVFLGQALTIMLVYIWSRRNPFIRMNFFGLLNFQAPYLPWVLLAFSVLLGNSVIVDVLGMVVGHLYFFLEDVYPNTRGGFKILKTPLFMRILMDPPDEVENDPRLSEDQNDPTNDDGNNGNDEVQPGGYDWSGRQRRPQEDADRHKLTDDPSRPSPSSSQQRISAGGPRQDAVHQTESQRAAALAAVARLDKQGQQASPQWSKTYIKAEAKKLIEDGMQSITLEGAGSGPAVVDLEAPSMLAATGVYFKCPLIGPEVLPKDAMVERIRSFLYEQLEEEPALTAVLIIFSLNGNQTKVEVCVATLRKYLENILSHPEDPKFRKIRKSNRVFQERVKPLEGADTFLEAAGFENSTETLEDGATEDFYVFPQTADSSTFETLIDALGNAEPIKPELDRGLRVLQPSKASENMNLPLDFFLLTPEELRMEVKQREDVLDKLTQLRTKSMRERDQIVEKRQYKYALIRVKFPDGVLLQGTFGVYEKIPAVVEFVQENIADDQSAFKLTAFAGTLNIDCVPGTDIRNQKTLIEAKLVPATILNFCWVDAPENLGNPLKKDVLALLEER